VAGARGASSGPPAPREPTPPEIAAFRETVFGYYREHGRALPWRETRDPYRVLVSEVMLQQTGVSRVLPKYEAWLERFPTLEALAAAPLEVVLEAWQGLGYNRRAIALKRTAETIAEEYDGEFPHDEIALRALPGIGPATAAGVLAFAFGEPAIYLETNVRAVFLHHFFADRDDVPDREIVPLVEATLDHDDPRTWYYALLDYGVHLKRTLPNPSRRSRHHTRQSPFEGSRRQKRARLLRAVLAGPGRDAAELAGEFGFDVDLAEELLVELAAEGFLSEEDGRYRVA
jgi:A/G-specific adenine glycosylase